MTRWSRRDMAKLFTLAACGCAMGQDRAGEGHPAVNLDGLKFRSGAVPQVREARFWEPLGDRKVRCKLCPHECVVADQERGTCGVRENRGGKYYTLAYGQVCSTHIDPIEKKPLFHYLPGTSALSIATSGCNMECQYCQNWQISQFRPEQVPSVDLPPTRVAALARQYASPTVAYTYSEPVVFYEYMYDVAAEARKLGIGSVMISNGYIQIEPLRKLIPVLSAIKVDFKGFSENFYTKVCRGHLKPVLDALAAIAAAGIWLELVMLVIPTLNDNLEENRKMFRWIRQNLGDQVPLHLTRFHPMYKLQNLPPTPVATLEKLSAEARQVGLKFVYVGNVYGHPEESTRCPSCNRMLIQRVGFEIVQNALKDGRCPSCQTRLPGVFSR
ncbi:MAG TPA: AmmeMemoRadiSam system radical SAM enzyme [Acidobacteriota bacterium]|nr:AmmeMemoRadiSam system radical SAM enzyme [Acidobacteriota bacterium]HQG91777.1 AmmeMemoRadiSam system radical SAM enzyme [Acidobacteriota bacterium]HQK88309.1 AmmeMemoRadiSam system radical SAM enzyme [Acidobacteriota bacterium]